ncbi:unknown [Coprobacillus sp. CAG:826]|nr:unknown [Coprobacillus sp. CAG:826]
MAVDAVTHAINDDGVDWNSAFISGVQWEFINTASAFLCSLGGPVSLWKVHYYLVYLAVLQAQLV